MTMFDLILQNPGYKGLVAILILVIYAILSKQVKNKRNENLKYSNCNEKFDSMSVPNTKIVIYS